MDELDSLDYYNGEPMHDMEVDYDYHIMHRGIYGWVLIFLERGFGSGPCPDCRGVADWCGFFWPRLLGASLNYAFFFWGGWG